MVLSILLWKITHEWSEGKNWINKYEILVVGCRCIQHNFVWRLIIYIILRHTQTHRIVYVVLRCIHMSVRAQAHVFVSYSYDEYMDASAACVWSAPSRFFIYAEACEPRIHVCVSVSSMCVFTFAFVCERVFSSCCFPLTILIKTLFAVELKKKKNWREDLFNTHTSKGQRRHIAMKWMEEMSSSSSSFCLFKFRCQRLLTIFN